MRSVLHRKIDTNYKVRHIYIIFGYYLFGKLDNHLKVRTKKYQNIK